VINAVCNRLFLGAFMGQKHEIGIAELEETIHEMRDEIGVDARLAGPSELAHHEPRETPGMAPPFISLALSARLDRIEKGVAMALELLQQFAHPDGTVAPIRGAERRPRFGARAPRA
jgi:hypothetical protein